MMQASPISSADKCFKNNIGKYWNQEKYFVKKKKNPKFKSQTK